MSTSTKTKSAAATPLTPLGTYLAAQDLTSTRHTELEDARATYSSYDIREDEGDDTVTSAERQVARDDIDKYTRLLAHAKKEEAKAKSSWNRAVAAESPDIAKVLTELIKSNLIALGLSPATPIIVQPRPLEAAPEEVTIVLCQVAPTVHDPNSGTCSGRVWANVFAPSNEALPPIDELLMKLIAKSPFDALGGNTSPIEKVERGVYKPYRIDVRRALLEIPHVATELTPTILKAAATTLESAIKANGEIHGTNGQFSHHRVRTLTGWATSISDVAHDNGVRTRTMRVTVAADPITSGDAEAWISNSTHLTGSYITGLGRCTSAKLVNFKPLTNGYKHVEAEMTFDYRAA